MSDNVLLYIGLALLALVALFAAWRLGRKAPPTRAEPQAPPIAVPPPSASTPARALPSVPATVDAAKALKAGLAKTRHGFVARLGGLLGKKQIDAALVDEIEEILFTADIGARTAHKLFDAVKTSLGRSELKEADQVWSVIRDESQAILDRAEAKAGPLDLSRTRPLVVLMIGVNGVGKTTSIGKLASRFAAEGKRVLLGAGDTFRAAATEQLDIWAQRTGVPIVKGKEGSDPSAVLFDAAKRAASEGFDLLLCDTAGRLHTKENLMAELEKIRRVVGKAVPEAPHETWLVLDATNGQNAIAQAATFKQAMDITGIILTKLDGTAKGGVVLGICDELEVPVRFVGIGEKVADLRPFDSREFVEALYDRDDMAAAS